MNIRTLLTKLVIVLIFHAFPLTAFSQTESIKVADKFGNELRALLNADTGSPHRIKYLDATVERYGYSMESLSPENVGAFGIELLADYEEILGVSALNF